MRLRFNGFDALVLVFIVVLVGILLRSELRHPPATGGAVIAPATRTVVFSITTLPTHYARAMIAHLQTGGELTVQTGGNFAPLGTLKSASVQPYRYTVNDGAGNLIRATDPSEHVLDLTVVAQAVVSDKTVSINGDAYFIDQSALFREGGSQFQAVITNEQVR